MGLAALNRRTSRLQVRCLTEVLLMVGRGDEQPGIIRQLLDVEAMSGKPQYLMAPKVMVPKATFTTVDDFLLFLTRSAQSQIPRGGCRQPPVQSWGIRLIRTHAVHGRGLACRRRNTYP